MENWIVIGILLLVLGAAGFYVYKSKKSGKKCIGCPDAAMCKRRNCGCCDTDSSTKEN